MKEYEIKTQGEFHRNLPKGDESDWIEFASLPIISGKLRVSDPMFFRDLPPRPTFDVADERAVMPLAASGFGDGGYPIHELLLDGKRVGVEVVFIGPEVLAE
jgi:hypothetical protein